MRQLFIFLLFFLSTFPLFSQNQKATYKPLGFEGVDYEEVEVVRQKYLTTHRQFLCDLLDDAFYYRLYVRRELEKRKMPSILEYLPVVESNYIPTAKSKSGATGLWQFMMNSIKPFLHVDNHIDERLDPYKSTDAALKKLQENYNMFHDWLLAITAYNCGAGAMSKAIKKAENLNVIERRRNDFNDRNECRNFWYLSRNGFLSEQASSYVPKLLAIADIVENSEFYEADFPTLKDENGITLDIPPEKFDYLTVKKSVSIKAIAYKLRIDENELLKMNVELVNDVTPPHKEYKIRLPEKSGEFY